jgi:hypothetical protein
MITKERFHVENLFLHQLCKCKEEKSSQLFIDFFLLLVFTEISFFSISLILPILILLLSFSTDLISRGHHGQNDLLLA